MNNLHNYTPAMLADEYGRLDRILKGIEDQKKAIRAEFDRRDLNIAAGEDYVMTATTSETRRLNQKRLADDLGDAMADYYETSLTTTVRVKQTTKLVSDVAA